MSEQLEAVLRDVRLAGPAPAGLVERVEQEMDCELPADVRAFLREHDGGAGTLGAQKRPVELWSIERIRDECEAQEVTRSVPGLVLFGSDGGAEGYGWLPRLRERRYGRISLIAAGAHEFEGLADTFADLLQSLSAGG
jgi:SMI1 / KNR4 family (SUKH-1)